MTARARAAKKPRCLCRNDGKILCAAHAREAGLPMAEGAVAVRIHGGHVSAKAARNASAPKKEPPR